MLIAILGIIILVVGIVLKRSPEPGSRFGGIVNTVGIALSPSDYLAPHSKL